MKKLLLEINNEHEMAKLSQGKTTLCYGNFWDFHAGCYGTKIEFEDGTVIDFDEEWDDSIRRPIPMANMVACKIGAELEVKYVTKEL